MDIDLQQEINQRISEINTRISNAAKKAGRSAEAIDLIAVTKKKDPIVIKTLFENGVTKIGESYFQEAAFKIEVLKDYDIEWHMIGPIQRGKEKKVAALFSTVHSVDRLEVARKLHQAAELHGKKLPVYLEFNISGEDTKYGWKAGDENAWEGLLDDIDVVMDLAGLNILGLMTMAPYDLNPEASRPYFIKLRKLRDWLSKRYSGKQLEGLSMGMSTDFEIAISEGATVLRIGTALVGTR